MRAFLIVGGVTFALYGLHRVALFAESRGWIFYKTRPPRVRMLGMLEALVDPRVEYTVEEQSSEAIRADHSESGDGYRDDDGSE
ncbi:MAG TPA: hypothetical protein VFS66_03940 [Acidimicrobiia bacterium]|nr:hypothetical protein [Acidimicrobiia bacterium]